MTIPNDAPPDAAWGAIARDQRMDRTLRRVCTLAWAVTGGALAMFAVVTALQVWHGLRLIAAGVAARDALVPVVMPFVYAVGGLALLVATLSTIGVLLRLRAASLAEIQLRLASLEGMLSRGGEGR